MDWRFPKAVEVGAIFTDETLWVLGGLIRPLSGHQESAHIFRKTIWAATNSNTGPVMLSSILDRARADRYSPDMADRAHILIRRRLFLVIIGHFQLFAIEHLVRLVVMTLIWSGESILGRSRPWPPTPLRRLDLLLSGAGTQRLDNLLSLILLKLDVTL